MKKLLSFIGASFLIVLTTAVAYASIPAPNGTVNGCYTNSTVSGVHGLGVVDSTGSCPTGTTSLNWNQTGPQGPTGATGATGPQGPAGISGKNFHTPNSISEVPGQWNNIAGGSSFTVTLPASETVRISFSTEGAGHLDWYRLLVDGVAIPATTQPVFNSSGPTDGTILYFFQNQGVDSWEYAVTLGSGTHSFEIDIWTDTPQRSFGATSMSIEALGS